MNNSSITLATVAAVVVAYFYFTSKQEALPQFQTSLIKDQFQEFELVSIVDHTDDIATYRFKLPSNNHKLGLPIGQHITIQYDFLNEETNEKSEIIRHYTPVSLDLETDGYFELLIKKYSLGKMSQLFRNIKVGDKIKVRGPKGFYNYEKILPKKDQLFMICGGTGITPMYQIIRYVYLNKHLDKTKITLIYGNQREEDILMKKELDSLVELMDGQLKIHYILDNAPKDESWVSKIGYVDKDLLVKAGLKAIDENDKNDSQVLLCGPPGLVSGMKKVLTSEFNYPRVKPLTKAEDKVFVF